MRAELGFEPDFTTEEAFADFAAGIGRAETGLERMLDGLSSSLPGGSTAPAPAAGARRG
jgi:hypothetical protein